MRVIFECEFLGCYTWLKLANSLLINYSISLNNQTLVTLLSQVGEQTLFLERSGRASSKLKQVPHWIPVSIPLQEEFKSLNSDAAYRTFLQNLKKLNPRP